MKGKLSSLYDDLRGKLGNIVASTGRGGPVVRGRVIPFNPQTVNQVAARAKLTTFSQSWSALDQAERTAWNAAVDSWKNTDVFGNKLTPSGFNLYVALNINLGIIGVAPIDTPPAVTAVPVLVSLSAAVVEATSVTLTTSPTALAAGAKWVICATAPMSAGRSGAGSGFRIIDVKSPGAFSPGNIKAAYELVHGSGYQAGQKIFFRVYGIDSTTGKKGAALECEAIVT